MSYTLSFDASMKFKPSSNLKGYLNHFSRELDSEFINHSNENIDKNRTNKNITLIYSKADGRMVKATCNQQIEDALYLRLGEAINLEEGTYKKTGKKVRDDACLAFGMILQLDPKFYEDNKGDSKALYQSFNDLLNLAKAEYGKENIVASSLHLDETNPHMHLIMTPVTADLRLNQKDFINSPKLKATHKRMRETMISKGYDIDLEKRTSQYAKRLNENDFKDMKRLESRISQNKAQIEEQTEKLKEITLKTKEALKEANSSSEGYLKYQNDYFRTNYPHLHQKCLDTYMAKIDSQYPSFTNNGLENDFYF